MKLKTSYLILIICLTVVAVFSRLVPHPANFTAMGAAALFAGTYFGKKWGVFAPLAIMLVTDAFLGFYELPVMLAVYVSFILIGCVGLYIKKQKTAARVFTGALSASIIFFVVTNFAVWAFTPFYSKTGAGLFSVYALAVPFFRNMLFGDIVYTAVLFGAYELVMKIQKRHPSKGVRNRIVIARSVNDKAIF